MDHYISFLGAGLGSSLLYMYLSKMNYKQRLTFVLFDLVQSSCTVTIFLGIYGGSWRNTLIGVFSKLVCHLMTYRQGTIRNIDSLYIELHPLGSSNWGSSITKR